MPRPGRVLLIDNSRAYAAIVSAAIAERLDIPVTVVDSLWAAEQSLAAGGDDPLLVLSGLVLPDADEAKVVRFFVERGLPLVVVTGVFDPATRERILAQPVIDYVLKDNPASVDYLVWLVERVWRNRSLTALVVDDSRAYRTQVASLLRLYGFTVLEAGSAEEGLALAQAHPELRLVISDFALPGMDGVQLVRKIRALHPRDRVAVIGISSSHSARGPISAQFIKSGANDYLNKPFLPEELFCRVAQNVENLEHIASLRRLATTDPLTGLRNRRSFFDLAQRYFTAPELKERPVAVAMLDIDFFKRVNDGHGHDCGDMVLGRVAHMLDRSARPHDVVARFGGEEFCILLPDLGPDQARESCDALRRQVETSPIAFGGGAVSVTLSIGLCALRRDSLHAMLSQADSALYRAKETGRNRVELARE